VSQEEKIVEKVHKIVIEESNWSTS